MTKTLLLYSTTDGHTLKLCRILAQQLEANNHQVSLHCIDKSEPTDLETYGKIVIGASIRYGRHSPKVQRFINNHQAILERLPSAFFSVNLVARKPHRNTPETNPYLIKFLRRIKWEPQALAVFAGMLDYPKYNFLDRQMIRLIMWMGKGPTDPTARVEFTDWEQVTAFGHKIAQM